MSEVTNLTEVMAAVREQEAALRQIQVTLDRLLRALGSAAPASEVREAPRLAAVTVTTSDPMEAGFTLSQRALADELGIPASYVSTLVRAFKLDEDHRCAMVVRPGAKRLVNYHHCAVERFRELLRDPPAHLDERARRTVEQVRHRLGEVAEAA